MRNTDPNQLRLGYAAELYGNCSGMKKPGALDLLYMWFGPYVITEENGKRKTDAFYDTEDCTIHACRANGKLFAGYDRTVQQLCGRLTGTAEGSPEKERKNAELMRKHLARRWTEVPEEIISLQENIDQKLQSLQEEEYFAFSEDLFDFLIACAVRREGQTPQERDEEAFPMDDEVFDGVIYNAMYQWNLVTREGLCSAYLWVLLGGLLRNETGRLLRLFDSGFVPVYRDRSETPSLISRLDALLYPEEYEYVYKGDGLDRRFPGIMFYCDACGDCLNTQEHFDDHLPQWQCRRCGCVSDLSMRVIYNTREDFENGRGPLDEEKYNDAVLRRRIERG